MSFDPTSLIIGVAAGGAAGLGISYASFFYPRGRGKKKVQVMHRDESGRLRKKMVTTEDLETSKREMRTLLLERDLLSAALTKVYEAENEGKITREEREMIAKRYSSQIRDLEGKLRDKELVVEVGELEGLRDELVTLFSEKIQNIESRLDQARERLPGASQQQQQQQEPARGIEASTSGASARSARVAPSGSSSSSPSLSSTSASAQSVQADSLERVVERRAPKRDDTEGERRVRAIRDEVMEALERLEQIDSRKEGEGT